MPLVGDITPFPDPEFGASIPEGVYGWELVRDVLEYTANCGNIANTNAENRINEILTQLGIAPQMAGQLTATLPSISEPSVTIPTDATGPDLSLFTQYNQDIIDTLVGLFESYFTDHFPADAATLAAVESWLQDAITNGGTGVNATVEAQIWERDRSRILMELDRAVADASDSWAARRFPIPPGALQFQTAQLQQKAQDDLAKSSREIAIKTWEIEVENVRFAVENGIKLRGIAVNAATDYIKALAMSQTTAYQLAISQSEAQNHLISAAAQYYNARSNAEETVWKARHANTLNNQEASRENLHSSLQVAIKKAEVAVADAQALAHQAAALLGNLHASASGGVSGSENTNHNISSEE